MIPKKKDAHTSVATKRYLNKLCTDLHPVFISAHKDCTGAKKGRERDRRDVE